MIKIGTVEDIDKIKALPIKVVDAVRDSLVILDEAYGMERDIERDLGGVIVIVQDESDLAELRKMNLDIHRDIPEYVEKILISLEEVWIKILFLLSDDYAIVVIGKESVMQMNKLNL